LEWTIGLLKFVFSGVDTGGEQPVAAQKAP
jgi:hypothetical protein